METIRQQMAKTEQHRFKLGEVDQTLLAQLNGNQATHYYAAMSFQLGCAIGELIAMGMNPDELLTVCDQLVDHALKTRTAGAG